MQCAIAGRDDVLAARGAAVQLCEEQFLDVNLPDKSRAKKLHLAGEPGRKLTAPAERPTPSVSAIIDSRAEDPMLNGQPIVSINK